jgi:MFS family permease
MTDGEGASGTGIVLLTLATGQFLMALDSSVMNVSIATVAEDLGTSITGVQTAITAYTLVMAAFMITGGTLGRRLGLRRAFLIGCLVYSSGSLTTALSPNLGVLLFGWSLLEGLGAVLIMPAIVGLVAANFPPAERPRAYGLVASAAAIAIAVGPLIGGVVTTEWSWRWVFAGEVVLVVAILFLARRFEDVPPDREVRIDAVAATLSATGLGLLVFGVLRSGVWGWVVPTEGGPAWLGLSPVTWLVLAGVAVLRVFLSREQRRSDQGLTPFLDPALLRIPQLRDSLVSFGLQFFVQMGLFFCVPLFLSVAIGLSAAETGARLLPLSVTLLLAAAGIPKWWPTASPRRVVIGGMAALAIALVALIAALDVGAGAEIVTVPLLVAGLGIGAVSSQLGAVAVSSVAEERTGEVGGIQNTFTNLGSSLGTALAGSVLIAGLTAAFLSGIADNPDVPPEVVEEADVRLAAGAPFLSDEQLEEALADSGLDAATTDAIVEENEEARLAGLRASLFIIAVVAIVATFFARRLPVAAIGREPVRDPAAAP